MFTNSKCFTIKTPDFKQLRCIIGVINTNEKRDKSVRSLFHWKVLKCRMLIFTTPHIIASPDIKNNSQIIIVYPGSVYSDVMILQLLQKFGIETMCTQMITSSTIELCLSYTLRAKIAPLWNLIGSNCLVRGRNFLIGKGPHDAISVAVFVNESMITIQMSSQKVRFPLDNALKERMFESTLVTVLPSLNRAEMVSVGDSIPMSCPYKSYREIQRHWKNVHGYRLPENDSGYVEVLFWTGPPLTYPQICVKTQQPIVTPALPQDCEQIIHNFLRDLQMKMPAILNMPLEYQLLPKTVQEVNQFTANKPSNAEMSSQTQESYPSQNVSLCTPTQNVPRKFNKNINHVPCTKYDKDGLVALNLNSKVIPTTSNLCAKNPLNTCLNQSIEGNTLNTTNITETCNIDKIVKPRTPIFHSRKSKPIENENLKMHEKIIPIFGPPKSDVQKSQFCMKSILENPTNQNRLEENKINNITEVVKIIPTFKKVNTKTFTNKISTINKKNKDNNKVIKVGMCKKEIKKPTKINTQIKKKQTLPKDHKKAIKKTILEEKKTNKRT